MQHASKLASLALLVLMLPFTEAEAQSGPWSTQGPSGCSDQLGSFDAYVPGMRGNGSCNRGGFVQNTNVIVVTNLNANGAGSLRAAIEAGCPKVILFGVSGLVNVGGVDNVWANNCDHWSLVGASAPGNITVTGAATNNIHTMGSYWTIDHITITGGVNDDAIAFNGVGGGNQTHGIVMNTNIIWGRDEYTQCYPPAGNEQNNLLHWQNFISTGILDAPGSHIVQNICKFNNTIRNMYTDAKARTPLVRGDGYVHANNVHINMMNDFSRVQPCDGTTGTIDSQVRMEFFDNLYAEGPSSGVAGMSGYIRNWDGAGCTNFQMWEDGNVAMAAPGRVIQNCANHNCTSGISGFTQNVIAAVHPQGYVSENITNTQQGFTTFVTQLSQYVGARPTDRFAYIQAEIDKAINAVDGSGPVSDFATTTTIASEGGLQVVTDQSITYDPTNGNQNPCGENMPTGSAANAIQSSGLTRLHEWVIGCFYDNVMPGGYREDGLQNYSAPGGGGLGPPPASPNPPAIINIS